MRIFLFSTIVWSTFASALTWQERLAVVRMAPGLQGAGSHLTFGLTRSQADRLYRLTHGQSDLRNLHLVPSRDLASLDWNEARLEGWLDADVPPPGFIGKADPDLASTWWHQKLELPKAWEKATGKGITLADCDSGWYTSETDINPNLILDQRYDLADKNNPFKVDDGNFVTHGTSVAAILVGALDGKGTNGIAFDSKLVPLQNFNYSSTLDTIPKEEATARCVLRAITIQSVRVVVLENQTAGGSSETFAGTRAAVRLALASGVTIVSAGGNYTKELTIEQGDDTGSIIVGAVDPDGKKSGFSNFGKRVSVAAYGRDLKTLEGPNGALGSFGGTSGATPQVAGLVALMLEVSPKLTPAQIKTILEKTRSTNADNKDVGGMVNFVGALDEAAKARSVVSRMADDQARLRRKVAAILATP